MAGKDVRAKIGYTGPTDRTPYFYANAHEKDYVPVEPVEVDILDARGLDTSLDREGFVLVEHGSAVADLTDAAQIAAVHCDEIAELLRRLTGAEEIAMVPRGILRYSERSPNVGTSDNSHPARFAHVDMSHEAAIAARAQTAPSPEITGGKAIVRSAQYNVWRVLSPPPQDVPLALCAWPSVARADLIDCLAIFDPPGGAPEWSFGNYVIRHNPAHRWFYYPDMTPQEAIVFKTSESDPGRAQLMPHGAFDNPLADNDAPPRVSLEMRGTAYWYA